MANYIPKPELTPYEQIITKYEINPEKSSMFDDIAKNLVPAKKVGFTSVWIDAGYENFTVAELAEQVKDVVEQEFSEKGPITVETTPSNDPRSYHVSSKKILQKLGWAPRRSIEDAVRDLCRAFKAGKLPNSLEDDRYINVRTVKKLTLE